MLFPFPGAASFTNTSQLNLSYCILLVSLYNNIAGVKSHNHVYRSCLAKQICLTFNHIGSQLKAG
jgi:hypothetical protein